MVAVLASKADVTKALPAAALTMAAAGGGRVADSSVRPQRAAGSVPARPANYSRPAVSVAGCSAARGKAGGFF